MKNDRINAAINNLS